MGYGGTHATGANEEGNMNADQQWNADYNAATAEWAAKAKTMNVDSLLSARAGLRVTLSAQPTSARATAALQVVTGRLHELGAL